MPRKAQCYCISINRRNRVTVYKVQVAVYRKLRRCSLLSIMQAAVSNVLNISHICQGT